MLYLFNSLLKQAYQPLNFMAQSGVAAFQFMGPMSRAIPGAAHLEAAYELVARLTKDYGKPAFEITSTQIGRKTVAVEEKVALAKPFCELRHFEKAVKQSGPKVLLVAPLSGHYATLLRPTVEALLPKHDVYITDWANAKFVPVEEGSFDLGDYAEYVKSFLEYLGPDTHVIAVCQPTVPVLCAIAHMAEDNHPCQPKSMALIAGPIDTRKSPTSVNEFALQHDMDWFRHRVIEQVTWNYPGGGRDVYPGFLQLAGFVSMNVERHVEAHLQYYRDLVKGNDNQAEKHAKFYDEYNAVLDMPAEFYLDTIQKVFREHHLPQGTMTLHGRLVRPECIKTTALLTIEGASDDITGEGQTYAAQDLCSSLAADRKQHLRVEGVGHYGTFGGSKFCEHILPALEAFIQQHK